MWLHYVVEEEPLGRVGAIKQGLSVLPPDVEMVIATNCDIITDQPPTELINTHRRHAGLATIMLCPLVSPYGIVATEKDGRVRDLLEKPPLPYWANGDVYVMGRGISSTFPTVVTTRQLPSQPLPSKAALLLIRVPPFGSMSIRSRT